MTIDALPSDELRRIDPHFCAATDQTREAIALCNALVNEVREVQALCKEAIAQRDQALAACAMLRALLNAKEAGL